MKIKITDITVQDLRFPKTQLESDYSAIYVTIHTNKPELHGHSFTFTTDKDTALCNAAVNAFKQHFMEKTLSELTSHMGTLWHKLTHDVQLRELGFDQDVIHLAIVAIVNALWDLWARNERKPLWRLIVDMSPEELVHCIDFTSISEVMTEEDALAILRHNALTKSKRIADLLHSGYPANVTSVSEFHYSEKTLHGVNESLADLLMAAKLAVPVRLYASEVGLCEYLQHLAMIDYIYISGSLQNRVLEYVEHLHEHFADPVIIENGHYQVPMLPGYSIKMKHQSLVDYSFPMGRMWQRHEDKTTREDGSRTH